MILWLLIPLLLGWLVARYQLRAVDAWSLASLSVTLAIVSTLMGVNFFYRTSSDLGSSISKTLIIQASLGLLLWLTRERTPLPLQHPPRWVNGTLLALSLIILAYTNAQQIALPDDDYWIHTSLQGLMRHDNFPPSNPFFSDIPMNGHYGRNLTIATFSYFSGVDVFLCQHILTTAAQLLAFWLFYSAFLESSKRFPTAILGSVFVLFGINAGSRGGLIDIIQNNNPFVHLYLAILCYLVVVVWKTGKVAVAVVGGLALGSYAIVYETHFGVVFFTILGVTPILWARGFIDRKKALAAFSILALSLPLAFTQGGPLTNLLERRLQGTEQAQAQNVSKGMQNQAQLVKVSFPKENLFQIFLETGEYQRVSYIYRLDTPLRALHQRSTERGYAYIWSWKVLKIHFLPLYLVPWSAFVLLKRGSLAGLFMGAFGTIAFLVPALVNFGPIYESEYYRWQVAASLGFAAALGLALATLLEEKGSSPAFSSTKSELVIASKGKRYLLVGLLTLLNSLASISLVGDRLAESVGPNLKAWLVFPSSKEWLTSHPVLDFDRLDFEAAQWLKDEVRAGDKVLTNFPEENNFSILYDATITGITGARCVGHALLLEDERTNTTPYRRSPAAQIFWETGRPEALAQLQVNWIFCRTVAKELPEFKATRLVQTFKHGERRIGIYRVEESALPLLSTSSEEENPSQLKAALQLPTTSMRGGRVYPVKLVLNKQNPRLNGTLVLYSVRQSDGLTSSDSENLRLKIEDGQQGTLEFPFVAPYNEGDFKLKASFHPAPDSSGLEIEETTFRSQFVTLLNQIALANLGTPETIPQGTLLTPQAILSIPEELPEPRDILASWAFYNPKKREFFRPPVDLLKRVELQENFENLPCLTPTTPGDYRLSLYLSAGQGHLIRVLGKTVTVR